MIKRLGLLVMVLAGLLSSTASALVLRTTADGNGADGGISNDSTQGPSWIGGVATNVGLRRYEGVRAKAVLLRFDLSTVGGDVSGAVLSVTTSSTANRARTVNVYGLADGDDDLWAEASLCYNTAPGLLAADSGYLSMDTAKWSLLGSIGFSSAAATNSGVVEMADFIAQDTNNLITLLLYTATSDNSQSWYCAMKEYSPDFPPPSLAFPNAELIEQEEQTNYLIERQMEYLDRGTIAVRTGSNKVYIGWRLLGDEWGKDIGFHIYRDTTRLTLSPITQSTNYIDTTSVNSTYSVSAVIDGVEGPACEAVSVWTTPYLEIPLEIPAGGTTPDAVEYTYSANDCSVGDLDGDGRYEIIVKWDPSNSKDNSQSGYTGNVYLDAYSLEGAFMWRIDLGRNIRAGAHYTQFIVYDLDGDGRAEVACKTADATIDGTGVVIGNAGADYRNSSGYILRGPEYLTIFDGPTGAALATTDFYPNRVSVSQWGDTYGNRVDRFLAGIAYVDGERPSLIMARGYYGPQNSSLPARNEIVAYNWRQGKLTQLWYFKAGLRINDNINSNYIGQGCHSLSIADVTGNGKDDILYGACAVKHDGTALYTTRLGHGDALHVSDMVPSRPGLEVFMPHESAASNGNFGATMRDAATGEILWYTTATGDVGRGVAFDIDPRYDGYEAWATNSGALYSATGDLISESRPSRVNFGIWWDGDLLRELLDGTIIEKWNYETNSLSRQLTAYNYGAAQNNGTKANPALVADLFGDWREEAVWRTGDSTKLLIFTTTIPAGRRLYTLMHDPVYRISVAWQNVAYNQPTHPGFFLGEGMAPPPTPKIRYAGQTSNTILWQWWQGIYGSSISDLTSHSTYPDHSDGYDYAVRFETPVNWDNSYGSRLRGYLVAPQTGEYSFWIAADDTALLYLSPDARPENAALIAQVSSYTGLRQWDRYPEQQSPSILLTAGRKYYIEALHKEGSGADHLSVAWQGPMLERQVIEGRYLRPWRAAIPCDLATFAHYWLAEDCSTGLEIDLNGDCIVNYRDFSTFAMDWLTLTTVIP